MGNTHTAARRVTPKPDPPKPTSRSPDPIRDDRQLPHNCCPVAGTIGSLEIRTHISRLTKLFGPVDIGRMSNLVGRMGDLWAVNLAQEKEAVRTLTGHALTNEVSHIRDTTASRVYAMLDTGTTATLVALYITDMIIAFLANDMYKDPHVGPGRDMLPSRSTNVGQHVLREYVLLAHTIANAVIPPVVQVFQHAADQLGRARKMLMHMIWGLTSSTLFPGAVQEYVKQVASRLTAQKAT